MSSKPDFRNGWTYLADAGSNSYACNCVGPQDGKPLCPCRMRNVQVQDGRYVEIIDHGPAEYPVSPLLRHVLAGRGRAWISPVIERDNLNLAILTGIALVGIAAAALAWSGGEV